ncbi:Mitochondrial import inner membrane translocase subunit TIM9 [Carex littledalei]|uniref:Mitochondrial import inner membrane translocase subunit TIM9 n=1 Tax=Carex littledalei TaxID=544730 RepID=A0A833RN08_9POAL|nr:Mitochondrial import inner membrane translocase subunit TIM9 [Carex littledalei]
MATLSLHFSPPIRTRTFPTMVACSNEQKPKSHRETPAHSSTAAPCALPHATPARFLSLSRPPHLPTLSRALPLAPSTVDPLRRVFPLCLAHGHLLRNEMTISHFLSSMKFKLTHFKLAMGNVEIICMISNMIFLNLAEGVSLRIYNPLVQRCFSDCVNSFGPKSLGKHEELCVFMTELNKLVNPWSISKLTENHSDREENLLKCLADLFFLRITLSQNSWYHAWKASFLCKQSVVKDVASLL